MRSLLLVCIALLVASAVLAQAEEEDSPGGFLPHTPVDWLVIAPIDHRARRPFNPDAVFARYLLDPGSPPPGEGDTLTGERGKEEAWKRQKPDAKGQVGGGIAWAYTTVVAPKDQIVMAWLKSGGTLFVNGTPHAGAIYGDRFEVPVKLVKGTNHVFVKGVRGAFKLTFSEPVSGIFLAPFRQTKPDLVAGEPVDTVAGLLIVNARQAHLGHASWRLEGNEWLAPARSEGVLPITALGMVQVHIPLKTKAGKTAPQEPGTVDVHIRVSGAYTPASQETTFKLRVHPREKAVIRTFVSKIDDSVQRFGMREPVADPKKRPRGLVLSLHGAGVNARGQVNAYGPKPDFWLFAPTNRDRFGFDWQDWGRLDAYEVLEQGLKISGVDRSRVYLTGHSMGGHGTWHLGANDPDGFAAIAPSAGWISFDTYPAPRRKGKLTDIWHAADGASKTRDLLDNLKQLPTFILHGEKDDNVPIAQAKEMEKLLRKAGAKVEVHYEPDQKHWWDDHPEAGAQCVDWPGIYDLYRKSRIPQAPKHIRFRGVDPGVDSRHHWVEVLQLERYGEPFTVEAIDMLGLITVSTENVRSLRLHRKTPPGTLSIDTSSFPDPKSIWDQGSRTFERMKGVWRPGAGLVERDKTPAAGGPFKQAFTNRFVLVCGTTGTPEEDKGLLEQARFDAQRWMYRANGQALLLRDTEWLAFAKGMDLLQRNAVLYGNSDTNSVFAARGAPQPIRRKAMRWPGCQWVGEDLACCLVRPGNQAGTLVGMIGSSGIIGSRLGFTTMLFVSGAGWPDYVFFDARVLAKGDDGVLAAGWSAHDWGVQPDGFVRKPAPPVSSK